MPAVTGQPEDLDFFALDGAAVSENGDSFIGGLAVNLSTSAAENEYFAGSLGGSPTIKKP